jgi:hypothetical protein
MLPLSLFGSAQFTAVTPRRTAQVDGFTMRWTQVGDLRSFTKAARRC